MEHKASLSMIHRKILSYHDDIDNSIMPLRIYSVTTSDLATLYV